MYPPGVEVRPLLRGGSGVHSFDRDQPAAYPTRLEAGTLNSHGLAGLHAALEYLLAEGVESLYAREHADAAVLPGRPGASRVRVYGDFSAPCRAAIVSLNIRDLDSGEVSDALLQGWGIATRPGAIARPGSTRLWAPGSRVRCALAFPPSTRRRRSTPPWPPWPSWPGDMQVCQTDWWEGIALRLFLYRIYTGEML